MDGQGLDGRLGSGGCAHTNNTANDEWFSVELDAPQYVTKVQITRRRSDSPDCCVNQGKGVRITIGSSGGYDSNEPLCRPEIADLDYGGLIDYPCTGNLHQGKYVKISKAGGYFVICEVKIFVTTEDSYEWEPLNDSCEGKVHEDFEVVSSKYQLSTHLEQ